MRVTADGAQEVWLCCVRAQICHLHSLRSLDLSQNLLKKLPKLLAAYLRNLAHLDLSRNCFRSIPPVLASLHNLRRLSLAENADLEARACGPIHQPTGALLCRRSLSQAFRLHLRASHAFTSRSQRHAACHAFVCQAAAHAVSADLWHFLCCRGGKMCQQSMAP